MSFEPKQIGGTKLWCGFGRKVKMLETLESRQVKPNQNRDDF
jgi:hypothetical protein